jgi:hypothetical protein
VPLLNYTTKIPAAKTAGEIQAILAKAGASGVAMEYRDREPVALAFTADTPFGPREFVLPVDAERVQAVLRRQRVSASMWSMDQARRVAWRIVKDWVEAQLAIIQTEMVTLDVVMLPYMRNGPAGTVYEQYRDQQLALEGGKG